MREQQVLALLAEGLSDREISRRLFISERIVQHHVSVVLAKTGVSSRTAAARQGRPAGHRDSGLDAAQDRPAPDSRADRSGWSPGTGLIGYAVPPPGRGAGRVHRCRWR
jgi:DNA-binding CsgD family transcriptional regulator